MPKLLRANIYENYGFEIPLEALCNVEYLRFCLGMNAKRKKKLFTFLVKLFSFLDKQFLASFLSCKRF